MERGLGRRKSPSETWRKRKVMAHLRSCCCVVEKLPPKRGEREKSWRICAVVVVSSKGSLRSVEREKLHGAFAQLLLIVGVTDRRIRLTTDAIGELCPSNPVDN